MTPAPKDNEAQAAFERELFDDARAAIVEYCREANANMSASERAALRITITIVANRDLRTVKKLLREYAAQAFAVDLNGARLAAVNHDIDTSAEPPGYWIEIAPPPYGGPATMRDPDPIPDGQGALRLTLTYGEDLNLQYRLRSADIWLPLGRQVPDQGPHVPVEVPRFVSAVPRGQLLLIHYLSGVTRLARTRDRPMYNIKVDGLLLPSGQAVVCRSEGTIEYHDRGRAGISSVIHYQAVEESRA